jgi:hypothetical protein
LWQWLEPGLHGSFLRLRRFVDSTPRIGGGLACLFVIHLRQRTVLQLGCCFRIDPALPLGGEAGSLRRASGWIFVRPVGRSGGFSTAVSGLCTTAAGSRIGLASLFRAAGIVSRRGVLSGGSSGTGIGGLRFGAFRRSFAAFQLLGAFRHQR